MNHILTALALSAGIALAFPPSYGFGQSDSGGSTFKRVKVKKRPIGSRIDIQVSPEEFEAQRRAPGAKPATKAPAATDVAKTEPKAPPNLQPWFWDGVSPKLKDAGLDRLEIAVRHMQVKSKQSAKLQPNSARLRTVAEKFGKEILRASINTDVSPALILAVISVESGGRSDAISSAGAQGLMQLIPATAERFKVTDASDPAQNIAGGAAYLDWLMKEFKNDPLLALAGYNAGENAVKKHKGVPPYPETRAYVPKVVAAWQVARTLCTTQPVLASDACVFRVAALK